jgi:hypothetical protein
MRDVPYKAILRCLSLGCRQIRYELPAHYYGVMHNYALYYRPEPLVHHHGKQKTFTLPYPEIILVGDSATHHCISVAFNAQGQPQNIYANINLPPVPHSCGYEWEDLELDIRASMHENGWKPEVVDIDEFEAANLPKTYQKLAWQEIEILLNKCANQEFPFGRQEWIIKPLLNY